MKHLLDTLPLGKKTKLLFGPPGTGKTQRLIQEYIACVRGGVALDRIVYVSFSRKAITEAKSRASKALGIKANQMKWFRTLHSIAFEALGINASQVLSRSDISIIARKCGLPLRPPPDHSWEIHDESADKYLFHEASARLTGTNLKDYFDKLPADTGIEYPKLLTLARILKAFKASRGKYDFTDMILLFVEKRITSCFEVVIVDEAQDLTTFQWRMVRLLSANANVVWVGGDDDQNVFEWAGARAQVMLDIASNPDSEVEVLPHSYRIGPEIKAVADAIIARVVGPRQPKVWSPENRPGTVDRQHDLSLSMLERPGSHLYLCRNEIYLDKTIDGFIVQGIPYYCHARSDWRVRCAIVKAFWSWKKLKAGETISCEEACMLYQSMAAGDAYGMGFKSRLEAEDPGLMVSYKDLCDRFGFHVDLEEDIRSVMQRARETEIAFIDSCRQHLPLIDMSTIHAAKGGEADHVYLDTRMTPKTKEAMLLNPDQEHRVWYVGVTRARRSLTILYNGDITDCYPI